LRSQRRLLLRAERIRPDCRKGLLDAADQIARSLEGLRQLNPAAGIEKSLCGIEGAAANAYFSAFTQLFPPSLDFTGRNRRPPRDPVNAALSLAYTMLYCEAVNACHIAGLDPFVGFFHEPAHNRESLAADLIEPLRARVDEWIWRLFAERKLRGDAFSRQEDACLLGKTGRQLFYAEYETFVRPMRRLLRRYALSVAQRLVADREAA
jgi:CRISPR-associated protein Cas1